MDNNLEYITKGDYQYPNLTMEVPEPEEDIGKYGSMRLRFLMEHRKMKYNGLLLAGKLRAHLLETNRRVKEEIEQTVEKMLETAPAPDKATNQMGWVQHINMLNARAEEMVIQEIIYN